MLRVVIPILDMWGDGATWIAGVEWMPSISDFNLVLPLPFGCNQGLPRADLLHQRQAGRTYIGT